MPDKITVIVVDDHPLFRAGVIEFLSQDDQIEVVGEGGTGSDAIQLVKAYSPSVAILDISMPDSGVAAAAEIGLPLSGGPISVLVHDRLAGYRLGR